MFQKGHTTGELICVKKSKRYWPNKAVPKKESTNSKDVLANCLNDYYSEKFAELVYSPEIYDMLMVAGFLSHVKGYVFQKVITTGTGYDVNTLLDG